MGQSTHMDQEDNRPKWLLELENRKRKVSHRLNKLLNILNSYI